MTVPWHAGLELMLMGMGTVFVFLVILIIGTTIMSTIISKITRAETSISLQSTPQSFDSEVAAVAAVAFAASKKQ